MATDTIYNYTRYADLTEEQRADVFDQRRVYGRDKVEQMVEDAKTLTAVTGIYHRAASIIPLVRPEASGLRVPANVQVLCSRPWTVPGCTDYSSDRELRKAQQ